MGNEDTSFIFGLVKISLVSLVSDLFKFEVLKIFPLNLVEKGYTKNWSEEIYAIKEIRQSNGVCWYYLESLDKKPVDGIWYYYQLNLVSSHADQSVRVSQEQ